MKIRVPGSLVNSRLVQLRSAVRDRMRHCQPAIEKLYKANRLEILLFSFFLSYFLVSLSFFFHIYLLFLTFSQLFTHSF